MILTNAFYSLYNLKKNSYCIEKMLGCRRQLSPFLQDEFIKVLKGLEGHVMDCEWWQLVGDDSQLLISSPMTETDVVASSSSVNKWMLYGLNKKHKRYVSFLKALQVNFLYTHSITYCLLFFMWAIISLCGKNCHIYVCTGE